MVDAHRPDRARAIERLTNERRVLNHEAGRLMRDIGLEAAQELGVSGGIVVVVDREGLLLTAESYGTARPSHAAVALDKTKTVLNYRSSSRGFGERMVELGLTRDDLAGQVGSVAAGGVGVWEDEGLQTFVGAVAFSGGLPMQDEAIAVKAVLDAGFYTKVTAIPQKEAKG